MFGKFVEPKNSIHLRTLPALKPPLNPAQEDFKPKWMKKWAHQGQEVWGVYTLVWANCRAHESYIHTTLQLPVFMALKGQALTSTAVSSAASPFWVAVVKA